MASPLPSSLNPLKSGRPVGLYSFHAVWGKRQLSQSPQIGASCRTYGKRLLWTSWIWSQSPQIGASCRTDETANGINFALQSQSPQIGASCRTAKKSYWMQLNSYVSIPSNRGVLSDHHPNASLRSVLLSLNPLKSGRPVGRKDVEHGANEDRLSQSPQIGASCRTKRRTGLSGTPREMSQSPQIGASCRTGELKTASWHVEKSQSPQIGASCRTRA